VWEPEEAGRLMQLVVGRSNARTRGDRRCRTSLQIGVTLIELLVVMAVISLLVAITLPAVQRVRESSRRVQCSNHLRQIGLAMHHFHDTRGYFPPGAVSIGSSAPARAVKRRLGVPDGVEHGWQVFLLPFCEQQALFDRYELSADWRDGLNAESREQVVPLFQCPSALQRTRFDLVRSGQWGEIIASVTDYGACGAIDPALHRRGWIDEASRRFPDGVLRPNVLNTMADILDGTSHTLWITEDAGRPERLVYGHRRMSGRATGAGWADRQNEFVVHGYSASGLETPGPCAINCNNDNEIYGFHFQGALASFADASVRFLPGDMDIRIVARLVTLSARDVSGLLPTD
jgi:prepilin-type N-terminal cleavage/methylation domain-containing protein